MPPQVSPISYGCSAGPKLINLGTPEAATDRASSCTALSTQPPDTDPRTVPSSITTMAEPTGSGAEPCTATTVANVTCRPAATAATRASSRSAVVDIVTGGQVGAVDQPYARGLSGDEPRAP